MDAISLHPGDLLRVERRFLVDGVVTTALSEGRFAGVRVLGTSEHLALEGGGEEVKLIPLTAVSEITIVQSAPRAPPPAAAPRAPAWDPGVV